MSFASIAPKQAYSARKINMSPFGGVVVCPSLLPAVAVSDIRLLRASQVIGLLGFPNMAFGSVFLNGKRDRVFPARVLVRCPPLLIILFGNTPAKKLQQLLVWYSEIFAGRVHPNRNTPSQD